MRAFVVGGACAFLAGCGPCIPKSVRTPESIALQGKPAAEVAIAHSERELRALAPTRDERLDAFVAATDFTKGDVALVQAGGDERALFVGATTNDGVTLYFTGRCSPCAGGNPSSYEDARRADDAARAARTEFVRVPKGSRVSVRVCNEGSCAACPTDMP